MTHHRCCDFKAHLMAVCAAENVLFYERATADPKVAFPQLWDFTEKRHRRHFVDRMDDGKRASIRADARQAIKDAQEVT